MSRAARNASHPLPSRSRSEGRIDEVRDRRRWLLVAIAVAVAAFVAAAAGIPGRATYGAQVSGDEPHYLLTAMSLGEEARLDVSDEISAGRYRAFHEVDLLRQAVTRPGGSRVVPHDPLLPLLLALPMRAGGWIAAKLTLAAVAATLAVLVLWVATRRFRVRLRVAAAVTAVFAMSAPLAVYGHQVYPELPAALATTAAVAALTGPMRRVGPVILGVAVVALPWLAVKYVPVAGVLAALGVVRLCRPTAGEGVTWEGTARRRDGLPPRWTSALTFTAIMAVCAAAYVSAHLYWYGGLTAYASGDFFRSHGGQLAVMGTDPHYLGRSQRLIGLLVGRGFGIAAWQPAWLLAVPAAAALVRRRPPGWVAVAAPLGAVWLVATFVAVTMQGWWAPGRQLVVALPLAVVAIAWWAGEATLPPVSQRRRVAVTAVLGVLGVCSYGWLAGQAAAGRLTWIVDFSDTADPWYRAWRLLLPDYLDVAPGTWVRHGCWIAVVAGLAGWSWLRAGRHGSGTESGTEVPPRQEAALITRP